MKFVMEIFENLLRKFKFNLNLTRLMGTLHEDKNKFLIKSRSVLLRTSNVSDNNGRENQNAHFVISKFLFHILPFML